MDISYYEKNGMIDGKWCIEKELGRGAFGTVYEISRKDFPDMKAALKIISIPSSQNEVSSYREENYDLDEKSVTSYFYGFVEEVMKEFRLMSQMKGHSNIVSYEDHDVKKREDCIGWDIFIRMELLTPMNKYFAQNAPKKKDVVKLGIDICRALEVCKKYNIIHRDIKPSNIFISQTGDYKLGDFGVARTLDKTSSGLSKKGTYTYMAPEVFKGDAYGSNVDIYSLGIVMYRLLNNNLEPFRKSRSHTDEEAALTCRLRGEEIPKPANADGRLAEIVIKACSYNPSDRYNNPTQMKTELEQILSEIPDEETVLLNENEEKFSSSVSAAKSRKQPSDIDKTKGLLEADTPDITDFDNDKTQAVFNSVVKINSIEDNREEREAVTELEIAEAESHIQEAVNVDEVKGASSKKRNIILSFAAVLVISLGIILFSQASNGPKDNSIDYVENYDMKISFNGNEVALEYPLIEVADICMISETDLTNIFGASSSLDGDILTVNNNGKIICMDVVGLNITDGQNNIGEFSVAPIKMESDIIMLPIRQAAEAMGANVGYNHEIRTIELSTQQSKPSNNNDAEKAEKTEEKPQKVVEKQPVQATTPAAPKKTTAVKTTRKKCPVCGSTAHTTHPKCSVCGSTTHTTHPKCSVCGSNAHTTHPKCSVCGSTAHTTHPKCPTCGSTSHTLCAPPDEGNSAPKV